MSLSFFSLSSFQNNLPRAQKPFFFFEFPKTKEEEESRFCYFFVSLSLPSRLHNLHKIHGKTGKKLTLSRSWTTAPVLVCAETRVYSVHYIGHATGRTAATRTTWCEYAAHLARVETVFGRKWEKRRKYGKNSHDHKRARTRAFDNLTQSFSSKHKLCKL